MPHADTHLLINRNLAVPLSEIDFQFARSSGPGGQNVNKNNTQAQLYWDVTETASLPSHVKRRLLAQQKNRITTEGILRVDSQRYRSQDKNRDDCLDRLREMILQANEVPKRRKKTRAPRWVKERRLKNKKERSKKKQLRKPPSFND